ncbi:unnamed protein product [Urochloa humidicola]
MPRGKNADRRVSTILSRCSGHPVHADVAWGSRAPSLTTRPAEWSRRGEDGGREEREQHNTCTGQHRRCIGAVTRGPGQRGRAANIWEEGRGHELERSRPEASHTARSSILSDNSRTRSSSGTSFRSGTGIGGQLRPEPGRRCPTPAMEKRAREEEHDIDGEDDELLCAMTGDGDGEVERGPPLPRSAPPTREGKKKSGASKGARGRPPRARRLHLRRRSCMTW